MGYLESRYSFVHSAGNHFYRFKADCLFGAIKKFSPIRPTAFLDLGCGCGDLAEAVHRKYAIEVSGIELDSAMVEEANKRNIGSFHCSSVLSPVASLKNRFDLIASFELFEHLKHEDHPQAIAIYRNYALPGAIGVIMVPNASHPLLGNWLSWSDYTHRTCFTPESLAQMLRDNGINEAKIYPWYLAGGPVLHLMRRSFGFFLGAIIKMFSGLLSTIPGSNDPFVSNPIPLSSHIVAIFKI